jgi:nucleoside-diphosphate-sugar epimerase
MNGIIIVDGAGGYIGSHVVKRLAGAGFRVRAVDLPRINLDHIAGPRVETAAFDMTRPETLPPVLDGASAIVHCAAAFDLSLPYEVLERVNVQGTRNLVKACQKAGIKRFIHFSTGGVYGESQYCPVDEKHPLKPVDAYSISKLGAEQEVTGAGNGLQYTVFRPTAVYGPGGKYIAGTFFSCICILAERKIPIPRILGGPMLNWVHVEDCAGAVEFALRDERTIRNIYNLAEAESYDAGEFVSVLGEHLGLKTRGQVRVAPGLVSALGRLGWHLPEIISTAPIAWLLKKEWKKVVSKHHLLPDLQPGWTLDLYPFLIGPHAYSSKALCDLGFVHQHPSFRKSFPGVVQWYRDQNWIPQA